MSQVTWHEQTSDETLLYLQSDVGGLSPNEADKRLATHGPNELPKEKTASWWVVLVRQFVGPMVMVLLVAAILSAALQEWVDAIVIMMAVLLNTVIGFIQEYKANKSLEQLRSLVQPRALVRRNGKDVEIAASELVPGDVLVLNAGDQVAADARVIEKVDLEINEAALTGESMPLKKTVDSLDAGTVLADRKNMVYAGTNVVGGRGLGIVVATGVNTEIGKIATLVKEAKESETPLQTQLKQLARWLAIFIMIAIVFIFALGLVSGHSLFEMFEMGIALAVAAIPEGLLVSVTVVLAIGMQRILKRKSLVRRLVAAETLGSVSVICSDKTGTITEGEMRVVKVVTPEEVFDFDKDQGPVGDIAEILDICVVCNDATVQKNEEGELVYRGSPTERALLLAGDDAGRPSERLRAGTKRFAEIPFDSAYKYMATLNTWEKACALLVKGAPEKILGFSTLSAEEKEQITKQAEELTEDGLRLIAVAKRSFEECSEISKEDIGDLAFLGFVCLRDPLRKEAREEIEVARHAGVRTVIITGDHPRTAQAIGKEAGILTANDHVVTGAMLDAWDDAELKDRVVDIDIYARVEPRHKIRIVNAWRSRGEVVAMTGDGVNDAPALKSADIGVALGSGTEVAKQSSDLVLLNNDLGTITAAIEQGRVLFDNIRKIVIYLLTSSFTEIVLIAGAIVFRLPVPLLAVHILWINVVQDSFPSMALTMDPGDKDILKQKPRPRDEPVLHHESLAIIFLVGLVSDFALFLVYLWYLGMGDIELARTLMFAAVGLNALLYVFAVRSLRQSVFTMNPFSNKWLIYSVGFGFGFMFLALFLPVIRDAFELTTLSLSDWGILLIIGVVKVVAIEVVKAFFRYKEA